MFTAKMRENSQRLKFKVVIAFLASLLVVALSPGLFSIAVSHAAEDDGDGFSGRHRFCSRTAQAAFRACRNEIRDDFWIAVGNCNNLTDPAARAECMREAKEELKSAKEDCSDQFDARQEICHELGQGAYDPQLDPADFVDPDDIGGSVQANLYFPLISGTVWVYEAESEEGTEIITVTVTEDTKEIEYPSESGQIFTCRVVRDVVELNGEPIEDTDDWYSQDMEGNVWYFGEISRNFEEGELVSLEGSWESGRDSAKPGILMFADPQEGDIYRQEFFLGDAEDIAKVISRGEESVTVPFGTYSDDVLKTKDYTPIEPDVLEYKYYAPGVGFVLEVKPATGERVELINKTTP